MGRAGADGDEERVAEYGIGGIPEAVSEGIHGVFLDTISLASVADAIAALAADRARLRAIVGGVPRSSMGSRASSINLLNSIQRFSSIRTGHADVNGRHRPSTDNAGQGMDIQREPDHEP